MGNRQDGIEGLSKSASEKKRLKIKGEAQACCPQTCERFHLEKGLTDSRGFRPSSGGS